ncbi:MAG: transcription elongation factor GreA [Patescibacteria group bacterium]
MQTPHRKPGKWTHHQADAFLTREKCDELERTLDRLKNVTRRQAAADVARFAELGDFSENAEYQAAKGRLRGINNRILVIENQLRQAVIIAPGKKSDVVRVGNTVTVTTGGRERTFQILGSTESDPSAGIISHISPIGSALLGRGVGDVVIVKLGEREVQYTIGAIS